MASPDIPETLDDEPQPLRLVVLAGYGPGADALAQHFGESHRCLVPLGGRPLIAHILQTAAQHPRVTSLAICVEREAFDPVWDVLTQTPGRGTVALVEAQADIAASVRAAAQDWDGPLLVTTADHALLSAASIDAMIEALQTADVAFAVTRREAVEAVHAGLDCAYVTLHDGAFAACDLYGMASPRFVDAVKVFRGARTADREAMRIWRAVGLGGFVMIRLGMETLAGALARASRRLGMRVRAVELTDGTQAIDVDDERTYAIVESLLEMPLIVPGPIAASRAATA